MANRTVTLDEDQIDMIIEEMRDLNRAQRSYLAHEDVDDEERKVIEQVIERRSLIVVALTTRH